MANSSDAAPPFLWGTATAAHQIEGGNVASDFWHVRGYFHWSLLDNFEWVHGYAQRLGLVAVDRESFVRSPKPSAFHLGAIARVAGERGPTWAG